MSTDMTSLPKSPLKGSDKKKESEAANLAKRKKEFGGEMDPKKTLRCQSWDQTETQVLVTLFSGKRMGSNEIDVEYTHHDVVVSLTDGRKWYCHFNQPIVKDESRVQLQKMKIILRVKKQVPGQIWPMYQFDPDAAPLPPVAPPRKQNPAKKSPKVKSAAVPAELNNPPATIMDLEPIALNPEIYDVEFFPEDEVRVIPPAPPLPPNLIQSPKKQSEAVFNLNHVKNDFYERDTDTIVGILYVKQINKESLNVSFNTQEVCVHFQTSALLNFYPGTDENTVFQWKIKVVDDIVPDKCSYKLNAAQVAFTLVKRDPRKWGALEASQAKSARVLPTTTDWQPAVLSSTTQISSSRSDLDGVVVGSKFGGSCSQTLTDSSPSTSTSRSTVLSDSSKEAVKPTCMVSPLNKSLETLPTFSLGMTGLDNLGNTCFMNSVLQVLANTKELRDYFINGLFQKEINHDNPLGSGGKLAVSFATLMKIVWSGKFKSHAPAKLKNLVAMKNSQFQGFAQHDAQEFMAYLLDGLHEDLNRVRNKPYTTEVDSDGRPDEVVANEAWERHKSRNDSYIVDLFQGQYKSKLVCPACGKVSITFDPFMHLSVPLPKKRKRLMRIIFMSRDPYKKPVMYLLRLCKEATADDLKDAMSQKTGVLPSNLIVFEAFRNKIHGFLDGATSLSSINNNDLIFVCEVLSMKLAGEQVLTIPCVQRTVQPVSIPTKCSNCKRECELKLKRCTKCLKTAYCNQQCQKQDWSRHKPNCYMCNECVGQPFIISLPKSQATFSRLASMMEAFSRWSLDVFQPPVSNSEHSVSPSSSTQELDGAVASTSSCSRPASSTVTRVSSSGSITSDVNSSEFNSQLSIDSQETSTTEVASSSSDASFVTVDSGMEINSISPVDSNLDLDQESTPLLPKDQSGESMTGSDQSNSEDTMPPGSVTPVLPPTGYVMGRQQEERGEPPFSIRQCTKDGKMIPGKEGNKLEDKGEEALDLSDIPYLAMDWRNHEKCKPYVLVQSKDLDYEEDESVHSEPLQENSNITLDQCLSLFTEPEVLSPDHAWYCPRCKQHREATKQLSIWRLPVYLIIQLKRFSFSSFIWRDKIDKMVEYPIRGLDLTENFIGNIPSSEPPPIYDLYGVVNHMGGILGGHYTSYARCPDTVDYKRSEIGWRLFDDSMVSSVSDKQVMTRAGYVLFYRRRNMTVSLPADVEDFTEATDENDEDLQTDKERLSDSDDTVGILESPSVEGASDLGNRYHGPSNSPSMYSFTDMDTVD